MMDLGPTLAARFFFRDFENGRRKTETEEDAQTECARARPCDLRDQWGTESDDFEAGGACNGVCR